MNCYLLNFFFIFEISHVEVLQVYAEKLLIAQQSFFFCVHFEGLYFLIIPPFTLHSVTLTFLLYRVRLVSSVLDCNFMIGSLIKCILFYFDCKSI
ncbi:MAG: hypothetical protein EXX96DRAFT_575480 [Benjaminiella poitrasii]|nr:MAG: hypothetical protein EXX96DRAFT_575480 [Benjaminiella poitrasii]